MTVVYKYTTNAKQDLGLTQQRGNVKCALCELPKLHALISSIDESTANYMADIYCPVSTEAASGQKTRGNRWCASYVMAAMLDDFDKGFSLFAILISSNMAKISLFIESLGNGCTPRIINGFS